MLESRLLLSLGGTGSVSSALPAFSKSRDACDDGKFSQSPHKTQDAVACTSSALHGLGNLGERPAPRYLDHRHKPAARKRPEKQIKPTFETRQRPLSQVLTFPSIAKTYKPFESPHIDAHRILRTLTGGCHRRFALSL
ncbi:hypothetical protein K402DRAFT_142355 [Aulographum hederae CBS 113979]|uniref:Uncharacterized protein n=1 Tax=Aulographum hederae CBS 113979 TaxID=1176131 RepID=A0A6G1GU95_9PEZI|nr:hypothetical protein K402DRAFT_142355 [Aulographum hederae CBS 113979]